MDQSQVPVIEVTIFGHAVVQTNNAKFLCIENAYEKLHRPNIFDIGGTYIQDVADFWLTCQTEMCDNIFLLHLFATKRQGDSFSIALSNSNNITIDKKKNEALLSSSLKNYNFNNVKDCSISYITTYTFSELDVDVLKNRKLLIPITFVERCLHKDVVQKGIENDIGFHDFSYLLTDPIASDFTMESNDGVKFLVHKVLLTTHSEVFRAMLKEDTAESQENYVKLFDISKDDMKCILQCIYTGIVYDIQGTNFSNLLFFADKYDLHGLRTQAEYVLAEEITIDNALETLVVADMCNSAGLKFAAMKFIKKYPNVIQSNMFKEIRNTDLVQELCCYIAS